MSLRDLVETDMIDRPTAFEVAPNAEALKDGAEGHRNPRSGNLVIDRRGIMNFHRQGTSIAIAGGQRPAGAAKRSACAAHCCDRRRIRIDCWLRRAAPLGWRMARRSIRRWGRVPSFAGRAFISIGSRFSPAGAFSWLGSKPLTG